MNAVQRAYYGSMISLLSGFLAWLQDSGYVEVKSHLVGGSSGHEITTLANTYMDAVRP